MHYGICENSVLHVLLFYRCLGFGPHYQSTRPFRVLSCGPSKFYLGFLQIMPSLSHEHAPYRPICNLSTKTKNKKNSALIAAEE